MHVMHVIRWLECMQHGRSLLPESQHHMYLIACRAAVDVLATAATAGHGSWKLVAAGVRQAATVDDQAQGSIKGRQRCCLCFLTCFLWCACCARLSCWICRTRHICIYVRICSAECLGCCCTWCAGTAMTAMAAGSPIAVLRALHSAAAVLAASGRCTVGFGITCCACDCTT